MIHGDDRSIRHKHGKSRRRCWRKLHIGVSNGLIVAKWLSEYRKIDDEIAPNLIYQIERIDSITADKAYNQSRVYEAAHDQLKAGGQITILRKMQLAALRQRNQHIKSSNLDGALAWRRTSGYYRQSEVENWR